MAEAVRFRWPSECPSPVRRATKLEMNLDQIAGEGAPPRLSPVVRNPLIKGRHDARNAYEDAEVGLGARLAGWSGILLRGELLRAGGGCCDRLDCDLSGT